MCPPFPGHTLSHQVIAFVAVGDREQIDHSHKGVKFLAEKGDDLSGQSYQEAGGLDMLR